MSSLVFGPVGCLLSLSLSDPVLISVFGQRQRFLQLDAVKTNRDSERDVQLSSGPNFQHDDAGQPQLFLLKMVLTCSLNKARLPVEGAHRICMTVTGRMLLTLSRT